MQRRKVYVDFTIGGDEKSCGISVEFLSLIISTETDNNLLFREPRRVRDFIPLEINAKDGSSPRHLEYNIFNILD